jgi:hypothetical protein
MRALFASLCCALLCMTGCMLRWMICEVEE